MPSTFEATATPRAPRAGDASSRATGSASRPTSVSPAAAGTAEMAGRFSASQPVRKGAAENAIDLQADEPGRRRCVEHLADGVGVQENGETDQQRSGENSALECAGEGKPPDDGLPDEQRHGDG